MARHLRSKPTGIHLSWEDGPVRRRVSKLGLEGSCNKLVDSRTAAAEVNKTNTRFTGTL
jgi:hypothetical protein